MDKEAGAGAFVWPQFFGGEMNVRKLIRRVTVETDRTYIFRNREAARALWCMECGAEVEMASVEAAAYETGVSELLIWQWLDVGTVHFTQTDRRLFVCLKSLRHQLALAEGERS